jgi:hypothetical protein
MGIRCFVAMLKVTAAKAKGRISGLLDAVEVIQTMRL